MSARLELRVSPITGLKYADARTPPPEFLNVVENDLDPRSPPFGFQSSFRGVCYNPLTRILLLCDPAACCVRTFDVDIRSDADFRVLPRGQIGDRGSSAGKFLCPVAVDVNTRGEVAVADYKLNRVAFFTGSGNALHYFGKTGSNRGEFRGIADIKFTLLGHVAVVDSDNSRIQVMTTTGGLVLIIGHPGWHHGGLSAPCAIDIARSGDVFVCDSGNKRIQRFSAKGKWLGMWGSTRVSASIASPKTPQYDANGFAVTVPPLKSVFDAPCDIAVGLTGELFVCDCARQEIIVFNDTGRCLHIISIPAKPKWSPIAACLARNSLLVVCQTATNDILKSNAFSDVPESSAEHKFLVIPPPERIATGRLAVWPWDTLLQTISFLTYADAMHVRLVNHVCHRACRLLRNAWRLYPLLPGTATIKQYNRTVQEATGLVQVSETFAKWGLRVFKPAKRIRRHVMDFDAGFRSAISALFGPMFFFQHENLLRELFCFHAGSKDKTEINEAGFVEIVTQIQEVRHGFLQWHQCPALVSLGCVPPLRQADIKPGLLKPAAKDTLELVERAQTNQLDKLLNKLRAL